MLDSSRKKTKRAQINKVIIEKEEVRVDTTEIQRISNYHKQLYANKMDNLEEMDKFLERYNHPRLHKERNGKYKQPNHKYYN